MDKKIAAYIESLVLNVFNSPNYSYIEGEESVKLQDKIRNHLELVALDTVIDSLETEQLESLKGRMQDTEYVSQKMEEFSEKNPMLIQDIETNLASAVEELKNDPSKLI